MQYTDLQALGLPEREARVYFAALTLGKGTVEQLAREAGIIRTTTYTQVDNLLKKGLLSHITEGKKTYYIAENPENLSRVVEEQKTAALMSESKLSSLLPDLSLMYSRSGSSPIVRFFPGKEGIVTMRNEVLDMTEKELMVAMAYDNFVKLFPKAADRNAFTKKRRKRGIKTKLLYTSSQDGSNEYAPKELKRVDTTEYPFEFDVYIFDNKVGIASTTDDLWAIIIESTAVEKSMRSLFNLVWSLHE